MITVTKEQINKIAPSATDKAIDLFLPFINQFAPEYEVNTVMRMASYLSEVLHESGCFRYVRELWGPTAQQKKYERDFKQPWKAGLTPADRNYVAYMLGNSQAGDGKILKGVGLIQITGRTNLLACSTDLFGDDRLLRNPELLTIPEYAVKSSFWFWKKHNLNKAADTPGILDDRKKVNGGTIGLADVQKLYDNCMQVLTT